MKNIYKKVIYSTIFTFIFTASANSPFKDLETTRLMSTAGTGIASPLMEESIVLNPASVGFYSTSAMYYQKDDNQLNRPQNLTTRSTHAFMMSEAKGAGGGTLSYERQIVGMDTRHHFGLSMARPVSEKTSMGVNFSYINDTYDSKKTIVTKKAHLGVMTAVSPNLTTGLVISDPTGKIQKDSHIDIGVQYVWERHIYFMFDSGTDYKKDLASNISYRGAMQFTVFSDFLIRMGAFWDQAKKLKGTGLGAAWVGPKLSIQFALKNSRPWKRKENGESEKDSSFSLSYRY